MFDFIGGEPLIEIEMINELCDYIVLKMYQLNHKWFNNYCFSFSTNGTLYGDKSVREFIDKHGTNCSFGISIDGNKEKHNLTRIKKDGTGSYDDIAKNFSLYFEEFPDAGTKSTFASDDLIYLKDSIIHLWNLGIRDVMSNLVYEDVWKDEDPELFESQLKELADYVLNNDLYDKYSVSYFDPQIGLPVSDEDLNANRCGAGYKSLAFDNEGNIYPCVHFIEMCFQDKSKYSKIIIGNIFSGISKDKIIPYAASSWRSVSPEKCQNCEVGTNCGWCLAVDLELNDSILERTTVICEMHKANARANKYFWKEYEKKTGRTSPHTLAKINKKGLKDLKYLYFITADNITPHCGYESNMSSDTKMTENMFNKGLDFCIDNSLIPVVLGKYEHSLNFDYKRFYNIYKPEGEVIYNPEDMVIFDGKTTINTSKGAIAIYTISKPFLADTASNILSLLSSFNRVNLFITGMDCWTVKEVSLYEQQLEIITDYLINEYKNCKKPQLNVITDLDYFPNDYFTDCGAGVTSLALAPNGKLYICPGIYFTDERLSIGSLDDYTKDYLKKIDKKRSAKCFSCQNRLCNRCLYQNLKATGEVSVPSDIQCRISHLNKVLSNKFISNTTKRIEGNIKYIGYIDELLNRDIEMFTAVY